MYGYASSGQVIHVTKELSILDAFRAAGVGVHPAPAGVAPVGPARPGCSRVRPIIATWCLTDDERAGNVMVCVSRSEVPGTGA